MFVCDQALNRYVDFRSELKKILIFLTVFLYFVSMNSSVCFLFNEAREGMGIFLLYFFILQIIFHKPNLFKKSSFVTKSSASDACVV